MCPPEYAELEGGNSNGSTSFRNLNHTAPGPCYASTSVLDSQYPLPPLPKTTSSEEGAHTGETSSGDSSSGAASAESRGRRSRSRASGSNSGSDSSGRGTTDTSCLGGGSVHQQVETRLTSSAAPSPYHRPPPGPPAIDPGLPPVPPLRGLSSYQVKYQARFLCNHNNQKGVRAGSFNSFGVGSSYCSGMDGLAGSHYSVPGLYSRQVNKVLINLWNKIYLLYICSVCLFVIMHAVVTLDG